MLLCTYLRREWVISWVVVSFVGVLVLRYWYLRCKWWQDKPHNTLIGVVTINMFTK